MAAVGGATESRTGRAVIVVCAAVIVAAFGWLLLPFEPGAVPVPPGRYWNREYNDDCAGNGGVLVWYLVARPKAVDRREGYLATAKEMRQGEDPLKSLGGREPTSADDMTAGAVAILRGLDGCDTSARNRLLASAVLAVAAVAGGLAVLWILRGGSGRSEKPRTADT